MYVMDYGAPVGWRLALKHPERITALIVQNGNAYDEGLKEFWDPIKAYWSDHSEEHRKALYVLVAPETTKFQYTDGVSRRQSRRAGQLGPRPGAARPARQRRHPDGPLLRLSHQPAALSGGAGLFPQAPAADADRLGQERQDFPADGAHPYKRDLPEVEFHLIDTGHFALEDKADEMVPLIRDFLKRKI